MKQIPVRILPVFWLLIFVIGYLNTFNIFATIVWMVVMLVSVLVHEYGHALTAVSFGQRARIELFGMGGVTHRTGGKDLKLWQDFLVVFNGPLAGFLLFVASFFIRVNFLENSKSLIAETLDVFIYVNLVWTIVNLLPIYPLDGGQLLRIVFEGLFGVKGVKLSLFLSTLLGFSLGIFGFMMSNLLIGVLFFLLTFESARQLQAMLYLTKQDRNQEVQHAFTEAEEALKSGRPEFALEKFAHVRQMAKNGIIFTAASEYMAKLLSDFGKKKEAYQVLYPIMANLNPEGLHLLHRLAYLTGHCKEGTEIGKKTYQIFPDYDVALVNAMCHASVGEVEPAVGWLETAINEGLPNIDDVLKQREFDHIRSSEPFQRLLR